MTVAELVLIGISFVIGYVLGNVYPVELAEEEQSDDQPIIEEIKHE